MRPSLPPRAAGAATTPLDLLHVEADQFRAILDRRPTFRASLLARVTAATA